MFFFTSIIHLSALGANALKLKEIVGSFDLGTKYCVKNFPSKIFVDLGMNRKLSNLWNQP